MRDLFPGLVGSMSEARIESIIETQDFFETINYNGHEEIINSLMTKTSDTSGHDFAETVEYCYHRCLDSLIRFLGIRLNDDETYGVYELLHILRGTYSLTEPESFDSVVDIIDEGVTSDETLCYLLASTEDQTVEWFIERIEYVDGALIDRIKNETLSVEFAEELDEKIQDILDTYKEYLTPEIQGVVYESLSNIEMLPLSFRGTFNSLQLQLRKLSPEVLIEELYQINLLANEPNSRLKENVMMVVDALYPDNLSLEAEFLNLLEERYVED